MNSGACQVLLAVLLLAPWSVAQIDGPPSRASITGEVLDALGEPLPACVVHLETGPRGAPPIAKTLTDGEGQFVFQVPSESARYVVRASSPGRVSDFGHASIGPSRPTDGVALRLWDAGTIKGRLVDGEGAPIEGAEVLAAYDTARVFGFEPQATARSDAHGRFELGGVPLGWIQVRAWKAGQSLVEESVWLRDESEVELAFGTEPSVRIEVGVEGLPEDVSASVRVLPYSGGSHMILPEPLVRGAASTQAPWIVTGLPDCEFVVSLNAEGYTFAPDRARLPPGEAMRRVKFTATAAPTDGEAADDAARIRGVLRDLEGKALAGERLVVRHHQGGRQADAVTDAEGRFECVAPRAPGTPCILYLVDSDYVTAQPKVEGHYGTWDARFLADHEFVVGAEEELVVRAAPTAVVSGVVVDDEGRPARWTRVQLQESSASRLPQWMTFAYGETDRDGAFRFRNLNPPQGGLRVSVGTGETGASVSAEFTLGFGKVVEGLRIVVARPGVVEGEVVDAEGRPLPGARVWLRNYDLATGQQSDGSVHEVLADRRGRYRFPDVEPGGHRIEVIVGDQRGPGAHSEMFEVGSKQTVEMPIKLP